MRRYAIRDDQWDRIKDLLLGREGYVGGTAADNRLFVEAVIFRFRAGIPWRDLPERFGKWSNVYQRFNRWAKSGVWSRIFKHLASEALFSSGPGQNVQTVRVGKGLASAVTPNTKSIAASEDQAKSSIGVDATLLPGF